MGAVPGRIALVMDGEAVKEYNFPRTKMKIDERLNMLLAPRE